MTTVTHWRWTTVQVCALALVAVSLAGCGSAGGDDATEPSGSGTSTEESETNDQPTTNPAANVGSEGILLPIQPVDEPWSAGELAGELEHSALVFSDGTKQEPETVKCTADETSGSIETGFSAFECNVEVANVPGYTIAVSVADNGKARFEVTEPAD